MTAIDPIKLGRALAAGIAIGDALPDDFLVDLDGGCVVTTREYADGSLELFVDGVAVPGRYVPHLRIEYRAPEHPCSECMTSDEDPRSWCDCGGRTDIYGPCAPPCMSRAHEVSACPNAPAGETRPYGALIAGDRIRTKTGAYCPVESTREVGADKVSVAVVLDGKVVTLVKDKAAPTTVIRGQAGRIADLFGDVQVISS